MGELLAPVGNIEMLQAAIDAGADAVFLAGPSYGARAKEASFDQEAFCEAIKRAHLFDVKVYVTLNTLIKEAELKDCFEYIDWLYLNGADALIVQDLGVIDYASSKYPDLPLHGSTQMAIHDVAGVKVAKKIGLSRVVIARETSLAQIKEILKVPGIACEVFVHGALCYAYSGQCLLSSAQGGRSGNRGQCAQPCRLNYRLKDDLGTRDVFAMSMKDLATLSHIDEIKDLGIASFKIEGRLRSADYVYHTVSAYRGALDGLEKPKLAVKEAHMYHAFNRDYTGGHLLQDSKRLNLTMSTNKGERVATTLKSTTFKLQLQLESEILKGDGLKVTFDNQSKGIEVFNIYTDGGTVPSAAAGQTVAIDFNGLVPVGSVVYRTRSSALTELRTQDDASKKIPITLDFQAALGQKMVLTIRDQGLSHTFEGLQDIESASKRATTEAEVAENLQKLGGTPFVIKDLNITMPETLFIPKSAINEIRRQAITWLTEARSNWHTDRTLAESIAKEVDSVSEIVVAVEAEANSEGNSEAKVNNIHIYVQTIEQGIEALKVDSALVFSSQVSVLEHFGKQVVPVAPVFAGERTPKIPWTENDPIAIGNLGDLETYPSQTYYWSLTTQVMNSKSLGVLNRLGVQDVLASVELAPIESRTLIAAGARVLAYGKLPVMYTRTCPKKQSGVLCGNCSKRFELTHDQNLAITVYCDGDLLTYYTQLPMVKEGYWMQATKPPMAVAFLDESSEQVQQVLAAITTGESFAGDRLNSYQKPVF